MGLSCRIAKISEYRCGKSPRPGYAECGAKITRRPYPALSQHAPDVGQPDLRIRNDQHRIDRESFRLAPVPEQVLRKPVHRLGAAVILRDKRERTRRGYPEDRIGNHRTGPAELPQFPRGKKE